MSKKEFVDALQAKPSYLIRKLADKISKAEDELMRVNKMRVQITTEAWEIIAETTNKNRMDTHLDAEECYRIADELEKEGK